MVRKIAKEFGVSSDYLLGLEVSGNVSLHGLSSEQSELITDLTELFRTQNMNLKHRLSAEQYEMLGRITASFVSK